MQSNEQIKEPDPTAFSDINRQYIQIVQVVGTIKEFDDAIGFDVLGKMEEGELKVALKALLFFIAFNGDENEEYLVEKAAASKVGSALLSKECSGSMILEVQTITQMMSI